MTVQYYAFPTKTVTLQETTFTFGVEKLSDIKDEIAPLFALHWNEVEKGTPLEMDVDYASYFVSEKNGQFAMFTARTDGKLVGYLACYVYQSGHAKREYIGREDAFFLSPECRGKGAASVFLDYVESSLKKLGCKIFALSSRHPTGGTDLVPWLTKRGYTPSAVVMMKELRDVL
jgi:GNAT superfamily N-acetyltransferase